MNTDNSKHHVELMEKVLMYLAGQAPGLNSGGEKNQHLRAAVSYWLSEHQGCLEHRYGFKTFKEAYENLYPCSSVSIRG
jgi:hypothetical protein